jgi:D-alanyl-D-alanine carboxypeptidase
LNVRRAILGITVIAVLVLLLVMPGFDSIPTSTTVAAVSTVTTTSTTTTLPATTTNPPPQVTTDSTSPEFQSSISPVDAADLPSSWDEGCPVGAEALRAVAVSHFGFDGEVHAGTLVVATEVAEDIVEIMFTLFANAYPIERMEPVDVYDGDDDLSMAANNTSAFNCRPVTGGSSWSEHSFGSAIDVNPLVNPYVVGGTVLPPEGAAYADRNLDVPGMIHDGDLVVEAFATHGWIWGGTWSSPKDYQHFSTSGR